MTASTLEERRSRFRALHTVGCFLLPNPWDAGSAKRLAKLGFQALASSSAAAAWSLGKQDYELTADDAVSHLQMLCAATDLPVNADFENGFSDDPETVAANVTRAIGAGVAGLSIEDRSGAGLRDDAHALACIKAARAAIDASGADVMLVARTEAYLAGRKEAKFATDRLVAFADAGADCLFAPGVTDLGTIADMVRAVGPKPLNVLRMSPDMDLAALADAGVRRISVGAGLAWVAWSAFDKAAAALREGLADR